MHKGLMNLTKPFMIKTKVRHIFSDEGASLSLNIFSTYPNVLCDRRLKPKEKHNPFIGILLNFSSKSLNDKDVSVYLFGSGVFTRTDREPENRCYRHLTRAHVAIEITRDMRESTLSSIFTRTTCIRIM